MAFAFIACGSSSDKTATATAYDDFVTSNITQMQQAVLAIQNIAPDSTEIAEAIKKYQTQIDSINKKIKSKPAYDDNKAYKNAAVNLGNVYKNAVTNYFADIAAIYNKSQDSTAVADIQKIIDTLKQEETKATKSFIKEREAFAEEYELDLMNKQ
ncbi:MAG: hypothetical protein ACK5NK_03520 [Niabella sp.]